METIKVPNSLNDMNLSHLPFVLAVGKMKQGGVTVDELPPQEVSDLNALFFHKELEYFDKFVTHDNRVLLKNILLSCERRKPEPIREVIEVDGIRYIWQSDYSKQPVSFHRDVQRCDFEDKPADLLAFCYIEEGIYYNQIDKVSKVVTNPRHERAKALATKFDLAQYLDIHTFFLQSLPVLQMLSNQSQLSRLKESNVKGK